MKKLLSCVLMIVVVLSLSTNLSAQEMKIHGATEFYEEKGQINLSNCEFTLVDEQLIITQKQSSPLYSRSEKNRVLQHLTESEGLKKAIQNIVENGGQVDAIGYTTVYLKEVVDGNGVNYIPMTKDEMVSLRASGSTVPKGLFTLYTTAYHTQRGTTRYVEASSVGHWGGGVGTAANTPGWGDDFITMSLPSEYLLSTSSFSGGFLGSYKHDEGYSSVVYGFSEYDGSLYTPNPVLYTTGNRSATAVSNKKFVSKYVHTWLGTTPSFSFSPSGVSVSLPNSNYSWQIASSVIISC